MAEQIDVLVVGAGPVGMTAALAVVKEGFTCTIVEAEPQDRVRAGSRAIYIHKATLQLLEEVSEGLGFRLARNGVIWPIKRTLYRGKEVYVRNYGVTNNKDPHNLPHFASLHQREIEKYLFEACVNAGVQFVWGEPVQSLNSTEDHVTITSENGTEWKAKYVFGADGARSKVREEAGIKLEGPRTNDTFIVVDVIEDEEDPMPLERVFHYHHPAMGKRNVMFVPFKGGVRIDLQLLPEDKLEDFATEEAVKEWLPKVMPEKYAERVTWVSSYRFYQVVANSFTDSNRRILLGGEAAHLFAPFGARGLNSGVPDAVIALRGIKKAEASSSDEERRAAIDAAANERKIAALWNRDGSTTALQHLQGASKEMEMKRELAASLVPIIPTLGRWLDEGPYGPKYGPPELTTKY